LNKLPTFLDPNEPEMEQWSGSLDDAEALLERRMIVARGNFYSTFKVGGNHPWVKRLRKEAKQYNEIIVDRERAAQSEFKAALKAKRDKEKVKVEGASEWDRSRRLTKHEKLWSNLAPLLEGV